MFTIYAIGQAAQSGNVKAAPVPAKQTSVVRTETGTVKSVNPEQTAAKPQQESGIGFIVTMLVVFGVLIYFSWSGQRKERKRREALIESLKAGDQVVTAGGLVGEIVSVKDDRVSVKISENTRVTVLKSHIGSTVKAEAASEAGKKEEKK